MLTGNKGKAIIIDPDTGEQLPVRKVRGSKAGGWIELCGPAAPLVVVAGEGIETVLAVRHAMMSCNLDLSTTAFWSLIDLGNIGGAAKASISHPTARDAAGRPRRVPGSDPDLDKPGVVLPASVTHVVLLGDGDSDPVMTQCAMYRGQVRFSAPGRTVYVAWAPPGMDFADLVCERDGIERIVAILQAAQPMARPEFPAPEASARARPAKPALAYVNGAAVPVVPAGGGRGGRGADVPSGAGGPKGRPVIKIVGGELDRCVNEAESALIGSDPEFYVYAGQLVRPVVHEAPGADMVQPASTV